MGSQGVVVERAPLEQKEACRGHRYHWKSMERGEYGQEEIRRLKEQEERRVRWLKRRARAEKGDWKFSQWKFCWCCTMKWLIERRSLVTCTNHRVTIYHSVIRVWVGL